MPTLTSTHAHNVYVGATLEFVTQLFFCFSCKICFHYMLLHCLSCSVLLAHQKNIEVQAVHNANLISKHINHINDVYLVANLTAEGLESYRFIRLLSKTILISTAAYFIAATDMPVMLQKPSLAEVICSYRTDHLIIFLLTWFFFSHTKRNCQHFNWFIHRTSLAVSSSALLRPSKL